MSCRPYFNCQLDYARQFAALYLPDMCEIYEPPNRQTAPRTAEGDIDDTYTSWFRTTEDGERRITEDGEERILANWTRTATVACLVRLPKLREQIVEAGQAIALIRPTILLPVDTVITTSSRIKITASLNPLLVGQSFNVTASPIDSLGSLRIAQVSQIE